jgi:hypothetical protein
MMGNALHLITPRGFILFDEALSSGRVATGYTRWRSLGRARLWGEVLGDIDDVVPVASAWGRQVG